MEKKSCNNNSSSRSACSLGHQAAHIKHGEKPRDNHYCLTQGIRAGQQLVWVVGTLVSNHCAASSKCGVLLKMIIAANWVWSLANNPQNLPQKGKRGRYKRHSKSEIWSDVHAGKAKSCLFFRNGAKDQAEGFFLGRASGAFPNTGPKSGLLGHYL